MKRVYLVAVVGTALFFLASGINLVLTSRANPLEVTRAYAVEKGEWTDDELVTLGGGYSSHFLRWKAHGRYRPEGDADTEVYVEIEKAAPFLAWKLVTYRVDRVPER